jgi:hypothetical protein
MNMFLGVLTNCLLQWLTSKGREELAKEQCTTHLALGVWTVSLPSHRPRSARSRAGFEPKCVGSKATLHRLRTQRPFLALTTRAY